MNRHAAIHQRWRTITVLLLGAKSGYINRFRQRVQRTVGLMGALGLPVSPRGVVRASSLGTALTLLAVLIGLVWTPPVEALQPYGLPWTASEIIAVLGTLAAMSLISARRRYNTARADWTRVNPALEIGLRAGPVLIDLAFAMMLAVQNLRWHAPHNLWSLALLLCAASLFLIPRRVRTISLLCLGCFGAAMLLCGRILLAETIFPGLPREAGPSFHLAFRMILLLASGMLAGTLSAGLYRIAAPMHAPRTPGLFLDITMKIGVLTVLTVASYLITDITRWSASAPYAGMAIFFFGLLYIRISLVRILSPETLGYALMLLRLAPGSAGALIRRSLILSACLTAPPAVMMSLWLAGGGRGFNTVLLIALLAFEISVDALVIQRGTAVLGASEMRRLPQRSKSGLAAALCGGLAVAFTGVLTSTGAHDISAGTALWAAVGFSVMAAMLIMLVLHDTAAWITELSQSPMEEP